ncbi:MAG: DUF6504 family protein [Phycisphaerales bacterium]
MPAPQFISEPITPAPGSFDPVGMARGEPGLPSHFTWRKQRHTVVEVIETWTTSNRSLCGETYLRRHWYKVRTESGSIVTLYCERQPKSGRTARRRWWLYTTE